MENTIKNNIFELLAPAGSYETFKAVINAGADAVYVGGSLFGARAYANNFSEEELISAIRYAHIRNRKVYLTVNTLLKNDEINNELIEYIRPYYLNGLDAVLVQDFGTLKLLHTAYPDLPLHTSTQMTITSEYGVRFLQKYGVTRVVMAREMSISEMKKIHDKTGIEIEAFIHGALCYSYSGQCLFSSIIGGRSGNRGRCAQPCRLSYEVLDSNKKKITDDTYILSLKDMCGINYLKELNEGGVYSLKIEGRMKQTSYAAGIVSYYRKYIDKYIKSHKEVVLNESDRNDIYALGNRCGFTADYYFRHNSSEMVTYSKPNYVTSNEKLHQAIKEKYTKEDYRLPVVGNAFFYKDSPAVFSVYYADYSVTVEGNIVSAAQKSPVTRQQIEARLKKTGDTAFEFVALDIDVDDNIFVPNGEINRLRREALDKLESEILEKFNRNELAIDENLIEKLIDGENETLSVSLEDRRLLELCLSKEYIDKIYIDYDSYTRESFLKEAIRDINAVNSHGKSAYLIMPAVFRSDTSVFFENENVIEILRHYKGFIVKNYEEVQYIKENINESLRDLEVVLDYNMYTYNDIAKNSFINEGILYDTVPIELNGREIARRNNIGSEMIIYGYYTLMTTAGCVHRNTTECDKCPQVNFLKDRYNKLFPVKNKCNECYNNIYNSVPTMLFANTEKLKQYGINHFRICFTVEDANMASKILNLYHNYRAENIDFEYTNGHFKRGVE